MPVDKLPTPREVAERIFRIVELAHRRIFISPLELRTISQRKILHNKFTHAVVRYLNFHGCVAKIYPYKKSAYVIIHTVSIEIEAYKPDSPISFSNAVCNVGRKSNI
jgi:hypothetical protein